MRQTKVTLTLLFFVAAVALFCPVEMSGQGMFGAISGSVTDPSGGVIPNAVVKVTNVDTGVVRTLKTNEVGIYNASSLIPGVYKVDVEAPGFKTASASGINLGVNANPKVDFTLEVGGASQVVNVTAEAALLNTQQSTLGQTVDQKMLSQLPIQGGSGRTFFSLVELSAGVTTQKGEGGYDIDNMRINGGRPRNDDYLLDGTTIQQPVWGGPSVTPDVDSIQEFRVETNNLSAQYGKVSGGVISAVTKGGTNGFHGSAYEFLRNDKLNARDFFLDPTKDKLPYRYNEFGGTFGGPAIKNKLFFFGDYQGIRSSTNTYDTGYTVPTAAIRNGDFSALSTQLIDPATGNTFVSETGQNAIPAGSISPISQAMTALWPDAQSVDPNDPAVGFYTAASPSRAKVNRVNARVDYNFSQNDRVFGVFHFQRERYDATSYFPNPLAANFYQANPAKSATLAWTHTFSGTMLNDFRFGYTHRNPARVPWGYGKSGPADFGFGIFPECPLPGSGGKCGAPTVSVPGYYDIGGGGGMLFEPAGSLTFSDVLTKVFGKHSLKFGGEFRHYSIDNIQPNAINGDFNFTSSNTGNAFADFLLGLVDNGNGQWQSKYLQSRSWAHAYFIQDDYKVTPRLTLNLGLRYQIDMSWHEINHQSGSFDPHTGQWQLYGINAPETPFNNDYSEFGPRFGFAWNPASNFVVRGGYGIMWPGSIGHGRGGDGEPSPTLLTSTIFNGYQWDNLPALLTSASDSQAILDANRNFSSYLDRTQGQPYVQQWNFTLEKQVARETLASISYIGSKGTHLPGQYFSNVCQRTAASTIATGWAGFGEDSPNCAPGNGSLFPWVQPDNDQVASSIYHAMALKVDRRFSSGFSMLGSFTWSKLIDDASSDWSGFGALDVTGGDYFNRRADRSVSQGDVPKRLVVAAVWQLPFGRGHQRLQQGIGSWVLGDWRVSGIYSAQTGGPLGVQEQGWGFCNAARAWNTRPNMVGDPLPAGYNRTLDHWFDVTAFDFSGGCPAGNLSAPTGPFDTAKPFGNAPRFLSKVRNPGLNMADLSVAKSFKLPIGETGRLEIQGDFFNAFNHPQFSPPQFYDSSLFGHVTSTRVPMRTIQLGAHIYF